jgi:peptide/nickel transport system substrate-binding protein
MKKVLFVLLPVALITLIATGCPGSGTTTLPNVNVTVPTYKGGIPDVIQYTVQTSKELGLKDVIDGNADIFLEGTSGADYRAFLDGKTTEEMDRIEEYVTPTISWSYLLNPTPNAAPYTWKVGEEELFNPFAIREVRFAFNWLFSRKKIVDEILKGDGFEQFTAMTPGQPGAYKYNLIPAKLGFMVDGDEKKAIADITAAIQKAADLPENKGKLVKNADGFWYYGDKPVTVNFYIRLDDPTGRLLAGRYVADQIEKAGIKVERIEVDRRACSAAVYSGNPADLQWHIYTEGWGAGGTRKYWDGSASQMYAPYIGYMPGGMWEEEGWWNYTNPEIDELMIKINNGQFLTEEEYWTDVLRATELGLKEAVRLYVCSMNQYVIANKERFIDGTRMVYGLGDGVNNWSLMTANIKPEKVKTDAGEKDMRVLKVKLYSAKGSLFMNAWDPVNPQGFNDVYAQAIVSLVSDGASLLTPNNADAEPWRANWKIESIQNKVKIVGDGLEGEIPVPAEALMYDSNQNKWVPAYNVKDPAGAKAGNGLMAWSTGTYSYAYGMWHNGQKVDVSDIMYLIAFAEDWSLQSGDADKRYDSGYASNSRPGIEAFNQSIVINQDGTFTTYFNYSWPLDFNYVAASGPVTAGIIPWEIREACALLVVEGGKKNPKYDFAGNEGAVEVDLAKKEPVEDIKEKLIQMRDSKYIPAYLKGTDWMNEQKALERYNASIKFIETYGHAYVSNGPYYIAKIEGESFVELRTIRELPNYDYPFTADYWYAHFLVKLTKINNVTVPATASRSSDVTVNVSLSQMTYPLDIPSDAGKDASVVLTLVTPNGERVFNGTYVKDGQFDITITADKLGDLTPGQYVMVIESKFGKEAPSVQTAMLNLN